MNKHRKISGVLRGYDQFMNIVLDEAFEEVSPSERNPLGMVVRYCLIFSYFDDLLFQAVRGNSVVQFDLLR